MRHNRNIISVELQNGITTIGDYAFDECNNLTEVILCDSLISIGEMTFPSELKATTTYQNGRYIGSESNPYMLLLGMEKRNVSSFTIHKDTKFIGHHAFWAASDLTAVVIPNGVLELDYFAFAFCESLAYLDLPESLTAIRLGAFYGCSSLTSVDIPNSVKTIGSNAFEDCTSLTTLELPADVRDIGDEIIRGCISLTSLTVDTASTKYHAVNNCIIETATKTLVLGCSSSVIPNDGTVTTIGPRAFAGVNGLTELRIPSCITTIMYSAFENCTNLSSVFISANVSSMDNPFTGAGELMTIKTITVDPANSTYYSAGNCVIESATGTLVVGCSGSVIPNDGSVTAFGYDAFSGSSITDVVIPDGVTSITTGTFQNCYNLQSVVIPGSVTTVEYGAFWACDELKTVYYEGTEEQWANVWIHIDGNDALKQAEFKFMAGHTEVIDAAVADTCTTSGLTEGKHCSICGKILVAQQTIPTKGHDFGEWIITKEPTESATGEKRRDCVNCDAFETAPVAALSHDHNRWEKVTLKAVAPTCTTSGLTEGSKCSGCGEILVAQQTIPAKGHIEEIVPGKAATCTETGLTEGKQCSVCNVVLIRQEIVPTLEHNFVDGICVCGQKKYSAGLKYRLSADGSYYTVTGIGTCTDTSLVIPSVYEGIPVTTIGEGAFSGNGNITSVELLDGITTINKNAFKNCSKLTEMILCDSLISIGEMALPTNLSGTTIYQNGIYLGSKSNPYMLLMDMEDTNASVFTIHKDTKFIGDYALQDAVNLTSVVIPNGVLEIGRQAFHNCKKLDSVDFAESLTAIRPYAFAVCTALTSIDLPNSVKVIEYNAFNMCTSLTALELPADFLSIGDEVISGCTSLTSLTVDAASTKYHAANNCIIQKATKTLVLGCSSSVIPSDGTVEIIGSQAFCGANGLVELNIPSCIIAIKGYAFEACTGLTSLFIPANVSSIAKTSFSGCKSLMTITVDPANSTYHSAGNCLIETATGTLVAGCSGSVILNDGSITAISGWAFDASAITDVTIPNGITNIATCTFQNCSKLQSIVIPASVTTIESSAFYGCHRLKTIYYLGTAEQWAKVIINSGNDPLKRAEVQFVTSHTEVIDAAVAATCTASGLTEGKHCSVCGEVLIAQQIIPAKGHTEVVLPSKDATCIEAGLTEGKKCSVCGVVLQTCNPIPALGHKEEIIPGKAATCTQTGLTEGKKCSVCGEIIAAQAIIPVKGHAEVVLAGKNATCTETGLTSGSSCSICNEMIKIQQIIPATGHTYIEGVCHCGNIDETYSPATKYTVTFVDHDGTILKTQTNIASGESAIAPKSPSREGYRFIGWDKAFDNVVSDITIIALYIQQFKVSFVDYNGTVLQDMWIDSGSSATPPSNPSRKGYTFNGWRGVYSNVYANQIIQATYIENTNKSSVKMTNAMGTVGEIVSLYINLSNKSGFISAISAMRRPSNSVCSAAPCVMIR